MAHQSPPPLVLQLQSQLQHEHQSNIDLSRALSPESRTGNAEHNLRETSNPSSSRATVSSFMSIRQSTSQDSSFSAGLLAKHNSSNDHLSDLAMTDGDTTPPTSCEDPSSQDHLTQSSAILQGPTDNEHRPAGSGARPRSPTGSGSPAEFARSGRTLNTSSNHTTPVLATAGQKRTASGTIKKTLSASPPPAGLAQSRSIAPAVAKAKQRHERNVSTTSSNGTVSELSAQLRARLSYALTKVEERSSRRSCSIETEPRSASTTIHSPLSATTGPSLLSTRFSTTSLSPDRSRPLAPLPERVANSHSPSQDHRRVNGHDTDLPRPSNPSDPSQTSRTYESFWRDHSANPTSALLQAQRYPIHSQSQSQQSPSAHNNVPSLAPPADITSATVSETEARRSTHQTPDQRPLSPESSTASASTTTKFLPTTPPPKALPSHHQRTPFLRTPSQKAAMEQDAVETLLCMSSPRGPPPQLHVNGHHHHHHRLTAISPHLHLPPRSPLIFGRHDGSNTLTKPSTSPSKGKRVEFSWATANAQESRSSTSTSSASDDDTDRPSPSARGSRNGDRLERIGKHRAYRGRSTREDEMDRMLDRMPEPTDDSDDDM